MLPCLRKYITKEEKCLACLSTLTCGLVTNSNSPNTRVFFCVTSGNIFFLGRCHVCALHHPMVSLS